MDSELVVVGAGPIGIEVAAALHRAGVDHIHLEAGPVGHTISCWPRNTCFFSSPEWIAIAGVPIQTPGQEPVTGEQYLAYLRQVIELIGLKVRTFEKVVGIRKDGGTFRLEVRRLNGQTVEYRSRRVVLAVGGMNEPNRLGIPGEELPHVTHRFRDPHEWFQRRVLIVGGRNSALEAALRCWRAGARVALSYRRGEFDESRVISRLRLEIGLLIRKGQIGFYPNTEPVAITPGAIRLRDTGCRGEQEVEAEFVFLATGHHPDNSLYREAGVTLTGERQLPRYDPRTMETDVPGIYVAGTATAGNQSGGYTVFITTCHDHAEKIVRAVTGEELAVISGNLPARAYPLSARDIE